MHLFVYSIISLSILKILLDFFAGPLYTSYSITIEFLIIAILLILLTRSYLKQKEGSREKIQRKIRKLETAYEDLEKKKE